MCSILVGNGWEYECSSTECFDWILNGKLAVYNEKLVSETQVEMDLANPDDALLGNEYDMFSLDATIIATGLGQLMDEGRIDADAKPFIMVAVRRQRYVGTGQFDGSTLDAIERVVSEA